MVPDVHKGGLEQKFIFIFAGVAVSGIICSLLLLIIFLVAKMFSFFSIMENFKDILADVTHIVVEVIKAAINQFAI